MNLNRSEKEASRLSRIFTVSVLLMPAIIMYATPIPTVSVGELWIILLIGVMIPDMISKHRRLRCNCFCWYLLYAFFSTLVISIVFLCTAFYDPLDMGERVLRDTFYFSVVFIFGAEYFNYKYALKIIKRIAIILSIYMVVQYITYSLLGVQLPNVIPFLKTNISGGYLGEELLERIGRSASYDGYLRVSGFFSEPAVCAHFLSVALLLELFPAVGKIKDFTTSFLYTIALVLTFSVNAYVAIVVCWGIWVLFNAKNHKKSGLITTILVFSIMIAGIVMIASNDITKRVFERLFLLGDTSITEGSSVVRVLRGMSFYFEMPTFFQIFGSGFGNFIQFKDIYGITTIYETADEYMNTNAYILVSSGIIGFILFVGSLYTIAKKRITISKMILLIVIMFGFSSSIYSSAQFVIMLSFILYAPKKEELLNEIKNYHIT